MKIELDETEQKKLQFALECCLVVARGYRQTTADENSIFLMQKLIEVDGILGMNLVRDEDHALVKLPER